MAKKQKKSIEESIHEAAKQSKVLRIQYTDKKGVTSTRNVEPYDIRGDRLWAYCRKRKGIRQFQIPAIKQATVTAYPYFPKWPVKLNESMSKTAAYHPWMDQSLSSYFGSYYHAELE